MGGKASVVPVGRTDCGRCGADVPRLRPIDSTASWSSLAPAATTRLCGIDGEDDSLLMPIDEGLWSPGLGLDSVPVPAGPEEGVVG